MDYALITGAGSGIGFALAKQLAARGCGILLVSRNTDRLESAARELKADFHIPAEIFVSDLSLPGAAEELYAAVKGCGIRVSVLINCAGFGLIGPAEQDDAQEIQRMLQLNVTALSVLCKLFLNDMYAQGRGKILNVASVGAFQPGPYTAAYYASKAFVLSYTRAIRYEAAKNGVEVSVLCPGSTKTAFFDRAGTQIPKHSMTPDAVAAYACKMWMKNRQIIIPGRLNRLLRVVPVPIKIAALARIKGKQSGLQNKERK